MALPVPTTPKTLFTTPKKVRSMKTPLLSDNTEHFATPRQITTPKHFKTMNFVSNTPECFAAVTLETPNNKRRSSRDHFYQVSNLTVAVRIRPMNARELACVGAANVVRVNGQDLIIRSNPLGNSSMSLDHVFQYDHVFWSCDETQPSYASQKDVFVTVGEPLLDSAFRGYNACLFAYGQTGSGKSFSMMGPSVNDVADIDSDFSGITPRFCRDLFDRITALGPASVSVEVSYFEIYNEKIHDLLSNTPNRTPLKVREHPELGPYVVDLSVHPVKTYKELRTWLMLGNRNRATAATAMNEKSSRSHSIFSIELCMEGGDEGDGEGGRRSKVSLVDLAGSERLGTVHGGGNDEKVRQGVCINKSLLTLGKVISALADQKKNQFVPYRESVLTWLLKESLGGNSLTCMLATITPANSHLDETLATLRYACQARTIVNRARINENPHDRLIRELKSEVQRLKALKQNYERRNSLLMNMSGNEEMEELRSKLTAAEGKLQSAENNWKRRFIESTEMQLKELAESEKRREELESRMRVAIKTEDNLDLDLSLYKTNFLEELEGVLTEKNVENEIAEKIIEWCRCHGLQCQVTPSGVIITDCANHRQTCCLLKDLVVNFESVDDFINRLSWTQIKTPKKLNKSEIVNSINLIYQTLNALQPSDNDNNLNLLFARVNKSLQAFEAALLHSLSKSHSPKTVKFNL